MDCKNFLYIAFCKLGNVPISLAVAFLSTVVNWKSPKGKGLKFLERFPCVPFASKSLFMIKFVFFFHYL